MAKYLATKLKVLQRGKHYITCDWGYYSDGKSWHKGLDLIGDKQKSDVSADYVVALDDGEVVNACNNVEGTTTETTTTLSMGNYVILQHANGWRTRYEHMKKGSVTVKKGDKVKKGDVLGFMGDTGNSQGRHLHFDVSNNKKQDNSKLFNNRYYVDPKPFLQGKRSVTGSASKTAETSEKTGKYEAITNVNVRKGAGTEFARVMFKDMTANAQEQIAKLDKSKPDFFPCGVVFTVSKVDNGWGKCPSGWVCLKYCKKV